MNRGFRQRFLRMVLALALLASPLIGDRIPLPLFSIAFGALLANDGLEYRTVGGSLALALLAELVWGINLGTISISYLVTALAVRLAERFVSFPVLASEQGWDIVPLGRALVTAGILALTMSAASVCVQSWVYHEGAFTILWQSMYRPAPAMTAVTAATAAFVLVILHRIDVPFRRAIRFGT